MRHALEYRLKNAIFSIPMLVCVVVGFGDLVRFRVQNFIVYNTYIGHCSFRDMGAIFLDDIYLAYSQSLFCLFAPVLAVIPAATIYCEDCNSGLIRLIMNRSTKKKYIYETIICSAISGGLAVALPCFLTEVLFMFYGKWNVEANKIHDYSTVFDESVYANFQYLWGGIALALFILLLNFLFGALWSNVGLLVSAITQNKYLTLVVPFAIYFASHLFLYKSEVLLVFSPTNMLMPEATFMPYKSYPLIYQIFLLCLVNSLYKRVMEGRLENV